MVYNLSGKQINLLVTLSNIVGFIGLWYCSGLTRVVLGLSVFSSILMHLSEQKHGLPGIYPFNCYSGTLLWVDRIAAYIAGVYALFYIMNVTKQIGFMIGYAILCGFISEVVITTQWHYYAIAGIKDPAVDTTVLYLVAHSMWTDVCQISV